MVRWLVPPGDDRCPEAMGSDIFSGFLGKGFSVLGVWGVGGLELPGFSVHRVLSFEVDRVWIYIRRVAIKENENTMNNDCAVA